ncbi:MAG: formate acetyltransferase, partial [Desulfobacula sp.]|nr:formate acetyltransferase [Desulfobacula sp.]
MLNQMTHGTLWLMALQFNQLPSLKKYLKSRDGWINFSVGFKSQTIEQAIIFKNGRVKVSKCIPEDIDVTLVFQDDTALKEMALNTPNEMLNLILKNRMVLDGNLACLQAFNFYISLLMGKVHQKMLARSHKKDVKDRKNNYGLCRPGLSKTLSDRKSYRMKGKANVDKGVKYLDDPFLPDFKIKDFPRLADFYNFHFDTLPEICAERPELMTQWFRTNGFEKDVNGVQWFPEMRQALAFKHLMENKKPFIRKHDLLAGTTSSKMVGVTVFPDGQGTMIWGELNSLEKRELIPFTCSKKTAKTLHYDVLPFWMRRNFREYVRNHYNYPLCQKLDERFVAYFVWKSVGISHTIPNFKRLLEKGSSGIIKDIQTRLQDTDLKVEQIETLKAMNIALEGVEAFAQNLGKEAIRLGRAESSQERKEELKRLFDICQKVPKKPAQTLAEAINAIWISWIGLHMENSNTGLSLGRLDQLLQPYFERDMEKLDSSEEKRIYIKHAVDLTGCLIMRLTDHVPLLPDIANYLFGGAASTQAITLGGVTRKGEDGVNDMTFIFLKAIELLPVRDTNINARYHTEKNSDNYLKRLCEVNIITSATPIMQSDTAMLKALSPQGYSIEDINDWAATGCVEPTLAGKHFGHTGSILMNMVAALEMALNNGHHPLMKWTPGPETGCIEKGDFLSFEDFFKAFETQQHFLINQAVELNNMFGKAHQELRPTPLLSAMIDGCIEKGKDVVNGGAQYNSSGTSNIGLVDVTDSLMVIKTLVFEKKTISFPELKKAVDSDFKNDPVLHATVQNKVPRFGSGDSQALEMCQRVSGVVHDIYKQHKN